MVTAPDIPGHTVSAVLGSGGFATVYRAWQIAVGREVAVKVDSRVLHTERDQRRFVREVTAAGRLSGHPHVIDVYDAGTLDDGRPYLVMELCPGGSLNDELRRNGPMSAARVHRIGIGLADALAAAHAAGILHRDIKPANILINRYGVVGLADFGLASIVAASGEQSATREALTPAYAPPESFWSVEPTTATDIYSLAATMYALMAGRPPRFPADARPASMASIMAMHEQPVEDIPGVPNSLVAILRQSLAADPAARPTSAAALRDDLADLMEQLVRAPARPAAMSAPRPMPPAQGRQPEVPQAWVPVPRQPAIPAGPPTWAAPPGGSAAETQPSGRVPHAGAPARQWRPLALAACVGGGLVLVTVAVLVIGTHIFTAGAGPSAATGANSSHGSGTTIDTFGIATTTLHCPAASVPGAGARCPSKPECWNGIVDMEGIITTSALPCTSSHYWQTFAIGILPADASTYNVNTVQANPTVRAVCSARVLARSRVGAARLIPGGRWNIQVVPPDEAAYNTGVRTYRCLASPGYHVSRTSQFGP
ncbi:MAG TPA: protein kinase [Streptosporangiaceae bacterium]|nr:protein kinase [Streptosporangiaceae bacterium]